MRDFTMASNAELDKVAIEQDRRQVAGAWLGAVTLSDVEPQPTEWIWSPRIAAGKLTLFAGDPGLGKSQATIDIAARITTGANWPDDGHAPVGNVIVLSAEDGLADTLRPRFEAAGGNLERVQVITAVTGKEGAVAASPYRAISHCSPTRWRSSATSSSSSSIR